MLKVNTKKVKINELRANKWNPKLKPEDDLDVQQQYEEVVKSVKAHGLIDPILVRSKNAGKDLGYYEIINGYHRFLACQELGFKEIIINDLGEVSDQQAKKLTIVTEEVKIPIDQVKLSHLLKEMLDSEELDKLVEGLPYSKELIESKIELLEFDWDSLNNNPEGEEADFTPSDNQDVPLDDCTLNLIFDSKQDRILVEKLFELLQKEQKQNSVPEALVSLAKTYGKKQ